jgi:hypothetical protein
VRATALCPQCAPAVRPVAVGSIPDSAPNISSIDCSGGDLARPGPGPADRGAAGAVRGATRRRPRHRPRGGRQRRALPPRRRHPDLEPDAAGAPAPPRGVRPEARRLPRPSTNTAVAHTAKHRPDQDDQHLREPRCPRQPTRMPDVGARAGRVGSPMAPPSDTLLPLPERPSSASFLVLATPVMRRAEQFPSGPRSHCSHRRSQTAYLTTFKQSARLFLSSRDSAIVTG